MAGIQGLEEFLQDREQNRGMGMLYLNIVLAEA